MNFQQSVMLGIVAAIIFCVTGCSPTQVEYDQSAKLKPQGYISFTSVAEGGTDIFLYEYTTVRYAYLLCSLQEPMYFN